VLKEGRNRVVRRTFEALELPVSRLMRVRFGIINLPPRIKRGMMSELGDVEVRKILEWVELPAGYTRQLSENERTQKLSRVRPRKNELARKPDNR
jgi:23S rRNA pseudouridine2605 synthase